MSKSISLEHAIRYMVNKFEMGHEIGYLRYEGAERRITEAIKRGTITKIISEDGKTINLDEKEFNEYLQRSFSRSNPSVISMMRNSNFFGL